MTGTKPKLAVLIDWFLPGYKAGGQIQSCANLSLALQDRFDIYVITSDRDLGDEQAYGGITPDRWNSLDNGLRVFYISPANLRYAGMKKLLHELQPDCLYINSMFSWKFTVLPLLARAASKLSARVVLAPRGMLHEGALQYKPLKKKLFLAAFKLAGLHKRVVFQATDNVELDDIRQVFYTEAAVSLVQDFHASTQQPFQAIKKEPGELSCLFVSRVAQKKNLLYLLLLLQKITTPVQLTIAGPVEEAGYWAECSRAIDLLPPHITVAVMGPVPHGELREIYLSHHLFILPTFGENFGHVIFESLLHGRPVLISDKTPWQGLQQKGAGWVFGLDKKELFIAAVETAAGWNQQAFDGHAQAAWQYAHDYRQKADLVNKYVDLFNAKEPTLSDQ